MHLLEVILNVEKRLFTGCSFLVELIPEKLLGYSGFKKVSVLCFNFFLLSYCEIFNS